MVSQTWAGRELRYVDPDRVREWYEAGWEFVTRTETGEVVVGWNREQPSKPVEC